MTDKNKQLTMLNENKNEDEQPVTVLGITFKNDQERRRYFTEELRKKLPELKEIEGFPIGEDEDILALSDPPFYTACPNPWINQIIEEWSNQKINKDVYDKQPFASDVREGKNDPVYMAHNYHTKVPHKAIMRYILHFTEPDDIVYDGFAGTGMTGVAAFNCGHINEIESLGFKVNSSNEITDNNGQVISKLGERKAILNDLSPSASFISYNYNRPTNKFNFEEIAKQILQKVSDELEWMYETYHEIDGSLEVDHNKNPVKGKINYVVWSDVFTCPQCSEELVYFDEVVDLNNSKFIKEFTCEYCGANLKKNDLEKLWVTYFDKALNKVIEQVKQVPVLINYSVKNKRFEKKPSTYDLSILKKIDELSVSSWFPSNELPEGQNTEQPKKSHGITNINHLYSKRNFMVLTEVFKEIEKYNNPLLYLWFTSSVTRTTKMYKFTLDRKMGTVSGTYYVPSLWTENKPFKLLERKIKDFTKVTYNQNSSFVVNNGSQTNLPMKENSIDYIFTDPPFGGNLMYSELNFLWEVWLKVFTNNNDEAVVNKVQKKTLYTYQQLMEKCFVNYYKVLKPGRWITVEFSNSQASVWNAIQEAIQRAGFVIANVSALDKKQGSFKAVTSTTAVKQDLVISAYKPNRNMISKIEDKKGTTETVWLFINQHLEKLPIFIGTKNESNLIIERTPRVLFDKMVAYHVQNNLSVPISSANFQQELKQRFPIRDGMVFLDTQVAEYDKKRVLIKEFTQLNLFVSDENSAIEWIRQQLMKKPQTRQDLLPNFMKEIQHIDKHELLPELDQLLEQNFLEYEGDGPVPDQIAGYLKKNYKDVRSLDKTNAEMKNKAINRWYVPDPNKQADLERLRDRSLLREFESYVEEISKSRKKLKQFRTEAIRAGFKKAWSDKEYQKIVDIGERLPEKVIQEDDQLLMYFDNAQIRLGM